MDIRYAERLMDILIDNSARILDAGFGWDRAGPTLFQIIELVREHPALKEPLLARIAASLREWQPKVPPHELIELVAHEMRWIELGELAERRIEQYFNGDRKLAVGDVARRIFDAQADDWPDLEFYGRQHSAGTGKAPT